MLVSLLWCSVSLQVCSNSTTNYTIEVNFYKNETGTTRYIPSDIVVDSSSNQYLFYYLNGSNSTLITKIATDGSHTWTKEYTDLNIKKLAKIAVLSADETVLRMLSQTSSRIWQLTEIYTSNLSLSLPFEKFFVWLIFSFGIKDILKCFFMNLMKIWSKMPFHNHS